MQILNISVMNRPSKSLTSKPYPVWHVESFGYTVSMDVKQDNYILGENCKWTAGIGDCTVRTLLNTYKADIEPIEHYAGIMYVQITKGVAYIPLKMDISTGKHIAGVMDCQVTRFVNYITYKMDVSEYKHIAGVLDVQITK